MKELREESLAIAKAIREVVKENQLGISEEVVFATLTYVSYISTIFAGDLPKITTEEGQFAKDLMVRVTDALAQTVSEIPKAETGG